MDASSIRSLRAGVLAVLGAGLLAMLVPAAMVTQSSLSKPIRHSGPRPTLLDCNEHPLHGLVIHPGQCVVVVAPGFQAAEQVRARQLSTAAQSVLTKADAHGTVHLRMQVPAHAQPAPDVLTFTGLGPVTGNARNGNLSVAVPQIAVLRYQVR